MSATNPAIRWIIPIGPQIFGQQSQIVDWVALCKCSAYSKFVDIMCTPSIQHFPCVITSVIMNVTSFGLLHQWIEHHAIHFSILDGAGSAPANTKTKDKKFSYKCEELLNHHLSSFVSFPSL